MFQKLLVNEEIESPCNTTKLHHFENQALIES